MDSGWLWGLQWEGNVLCCSGILKPYHPLALRDMYIMELGHGNGPKSLDRNDIFDLITCAILLFSIFSLDFSFDVFDQARFASQSASLQLTLRLQHPWMRNSSWLQFTPILFILLFDIGIRT